MVASKVREYISDWMKCGYAADIPDEVPTALMADCLAPSYKAIAIAILKNDPSMQSLGFTPRKCSSYMRLKRIEIANRGTQ